MYIWHFLQKKCWLFTVPRGEWEHSSEDKCWENAASSKKPGPSHLMLLAIFYNSASFICRTLLYVCVYNAILHTDCEVKDTNVHADTKLLLKARYLNTFTDFEFTNYEMGKSFRKSMIFLCNFGKHNVHGTTEYWFHGRFGQTQEIKYHWERVLVLTLQKKSIILCQTQQRSCGGVGWPEKCFLPTPLSFPGLFLGACLISPQAI